MEMLKYYIDIFCISDAVVTLYFDLYLKYILIVLFIMRPSSLGGAAYCVALCLSVRPSVPLSLPSVTSRHLASYNDTHVLFGTR